MTQRFSESLSLSQIILCALQNEIVIDSSISARLSLKGVHFDYKVLKQGALTAKYGVFLKGALIAAAILMPIKIFFDIILLILLLLFKPFLGKPSNEDSKTVIVPSTLSNIDLIITGLRKLRYSADPVICDTGNLLFIVRWGTLSDLSHIVWLSLKVVANIIIFKRCISFLLHSRDVVILCGLAILCKGKWSDCVLVTDDHYQRWAFVMSKTNSQLTLIQHGELDFNIDFESSYGKIETLLAYDRASVSAFQNYYSSVENFEISHNLIELDASNSNKDSLLLASSFPFIDDEIQFLISFNAAYNYPIIIKFHPAHKYDARKKTLAECAAYFCKNSEYPQCRLLVTYNSSIARIYQAHGIPVLFLANYESSKAAVSRAIEILN